MFAKMTRLQADGLLLLTAAIWGLAFVAQKSGMVGLGPLGFIGIRSALSALVVLPLFMAEQRNSATKPPVTRRDGLLMCATAVMFFGGVWCQQAGMVTARVTNAGFLTALYVVCTPVIGLILFRHRQSFIVWPACLVAIAGVYLLNGGSLAQFAPGDWLILLCALFFGIQINLVGSLVQRLQRPVTLCLMQSLLCTVIGLGLGGVTEGISWHAVTTNLVPLLYAGVISGGVGFTLQAFAQQHTPSADAAIIMSAEALFAAVGGAFLLHEHLGVVSWIGCGMIFTAILAVELYPLMTKKAAPV